MKIVCLSGYARQVKRLLTIVEREEMEAAIAENPTRYPVIPRTGGFRKARWGRGSSGKSGGVRTIFYYYVTAQEIYFAAIYSKNQQENLSHAQEKELKEIVGAIEEKSR
jgi:hypothetical protein